MKKLVNARYVLTREEVAEAFGATGKLRFSKKKAAMQTAGLALCIGIFTYYGIMVGFSMLYVIIIALCAVMAAVVWLVPMRNEAAMIDRAVSGQTTDVSISPGSVAIYIRESNFRWTADKPRVKYTDRLIILRLEDRRLFVIPKRVLSPDELTLAIQNLEADKEQENEKT